MTRFSGVNGPLDGAAVTCGETVTVALVTNVFGDAVETWLAIAKVCTGDVEVAAAVLFRLFWFFC